MKHISELLIANPLIQEGLANGKLADLKSLFNQSQKKGEYNGKK